MLLTDGLISVARKAGRIFKMATLMRQTPNLVFKTWVLPAGVTIYREDFMEKVIIYLKL